MRGKRILQLILLLALTIPIQVSAQAIDPSEKGEWSEIIPMPIVSVAAANLPNGKILTWSAFDRFRFGGRNGKTYTVIFDPETQQSEEFLISDTQHDMFCPGTANLTDGRIMVTGGSGPPKTSIYDPFENKWTSGEDMNIPRGYHAMVTLSDGNVFTIGGSWSGGRGNKHSEVWDRKTGKWSKKSGIPVAAMGNSSDYHAWLWQAPNGKLFHAGPTKEMHWIDYSTANGSYESAGSRAADDHAFSGAIVMYDKGKLLKIGGATTFSGGQVANGITTIMDINKDKVQLKQVGSLNTPRALHNATVLPTGEVFISGGLATAKYFSDTGARLTPELWNPKTEKWTAVAPMQVPRNYHSSAILLPDGRVMLSGGGLCGGCKVNHPDAEIYSPPYLFNSQGKLATRPVIKSAPDKAPQGSVITLNTDKAISYFSIVRFSSNTHSTNNEQRRIELPATRVGKNQYQVSIPTPNVAVPGYYMLFAIDGNGVPSVSKSIMLDPEAPAQNKCVIEGVALEYNLNLSGWRQMAGTTFTVKVGDRLNISANPNGQASYVWNGPAGFRKTGNKNGDILLANKVTANMGGKYEVTLRYNNGCVKKKAFTLQVITPPTNFFAHWKLDNNARDAIGNAHGALKAGAKLVNDAERGKVLSVEGEGQHMLVNPKPQLQVGTGGQDFTVAFWMNLKQSHTGKWRSVIHKGLNSRDRTFAMWMRPKDNKIHFRISTTQSWNEGANSKASIPLNTWTHIAYVHEGKKLKLYINGELDQTVNLRGVSLSNNAKLYLGDSPWSQTAKSRMDDVRLYGYALSADDIARLIPGCEASGLISASYWYEVSGGSVGDIPLNRQPDDRELITLFETPTNVRDNYAARVSGYICPPTTGDYTFWIASDDNGELYISPDEKPENKELVAFVPGWTNARKYDKYDAQRSSKLRLVKGKKYYVEALMNEGGGGDNLSVAWTLPNGKLEGPISGAYLAPFMEEEKLTQTITFQPVGDKPKTADNFQLTATSSSKLAVSFSVVSGPASIDGNKVSLTGGKGVVRIKAFQAGNAVFEPAEAFQEFNVVEEINDDCQGEGTITLDTWKNIPGRLISDIPLNTPPTTSKDISLFEIAPDTDDQYGSRIRGYVVAPITGMYTFWIASDDHGELWISTDDKPTNKKKVAEVEGWTPYRNWDFRTGQKSAPIKLEACKKYYIEALQKEDAAGDNLSVGWQLPDGRKERPIPGTRLIPYQQEEGECEFVLRNGRALDIGSGGGKTYVVGTNRDLYQRFGNTWRRLSSTVDLNRLDVTGTGIVWGVSTTNTIHYFTPDGWVKTNGAAKDVGADGTTLCVIGMNNRIFQRNGNSWKALTNKAALRVDVRQGNPWIVGTDGFVYQYHQNKWLKKGNFKARDIAVVEGGKDVWALSQATGDVYKYMLNGVWEKVPGRADHITAGSDGTVWVVNSRNRIYERTCVDPTKVSPQNSFVSVNTPEEISDDKLTVYPNPVSNTLYLKWESLTTLPDYLKVEIMDITGRTVVHAEVATSGAQVAVRDLAKGVYTLRVQAGDIQKTIRITKLE